jgi:REP element-mobilizing transposase RayT
MTPNPHKGWHSRGYLPHFDNPGTLQSITFRLADTLPQSKKHLWEEKDPQLKYQKIEHLLDQGLGECWLKNPAIAGIVENAFLHFDGERYHLLAWVIMPNHVHLLIETKHGFALGDVIHSWKSYTSLKSNEALSRQGDFWSPDYFDRYIRNHDHYQRVIRYIHNNPVKAGLVADSKDWQWSSARFAPLKPKREIAAPNGAF